MPFDTSMTLASVPPPVAPAYVPEPPVAVQVPESVWLSPLLMLVRYSPEKVSVPPGPV